MTTYRVRVTPKFDGSQDPMRSPEYRDIDFTDQHHAIEWLGHMNLHNDAFFYSIDAPTQVPVSSKEPERPDRPAAIPAADGSVAQQLDHACELLAHWYAGAMLTWHLVISTEREQLYLETREVLQAQEARVHYGG